MKKSYLAAICFIFICVLSACQSSKPYLAKNIKQTTDSLQKPIYSVFLIGDAGKAQANEPCLQVLQKMAEKSGKNSAVIYLGDNIYPFGLPDSNTTTRKEAELYLTRQLAIFKNYEGFPLMIPGNHDWNMSLKGGMEAVMREEKFVEQYLNRGNTFLPDSACPDSKEILLTDNIVLLALDTEWWFHEHEKPQGKNSRCTSKTPEDFIKYVKETIAKHKGKHIIVAAHHPLVSNSKYFTWKSHIFPLTDFNKKWLFPLPILGSLYVGYRKLGLSRHDIIHKNSKKLQENLFQAFGNQPLIYAAGHDHNLQLHQQKQQYFVVSGSGSKLRDVPKRHGALFTANQKGFAVVHFYQNNPKPVIEYINEKGEILLRMELF